MSIVSVVEDLPSRTGDINWKFERTYKRIFKVICSSDADDASVVNFAVDPGTGLAIPGLRTSYPTDALALVEKKSAVKVSGQPRYWIVTVDYSSTFYINPATMVENPLLRPAITSYSWEKNEKFVREDLDHDPIANSAGTPFDPPMSIPYGTKVISITKNRAALPFASVLDLSESCNSDTWTDPNGLVYPPFTVLIRGVNCVEKWENNVLYFECAWTLAYRSLDYDGWDLTYVLDAGFYEKLADGTVRIIRDKFGSPMPQMSMLKNGKVKLSTDPPQYIPFRLRKSLAFTGLIP